MYTIVQTYQSIRLLHIAKSACEPEWSWNSDANRWTGYHLWFVLSGGAQICVGQEEYHLAAGDLFLFDLARNHCCTHDPLNPLTVYSAYFHWDDAAVLCAPPFVPQRAVGQRTLNSALFERLLQADADDEARCLWFLPILHQLFTETQCPVRAENTLIDQLRSDIESHPERTLHLDALCRQYGYSKNHLIRLFKAQIGQTPYEYHLDRKIEKAKQLILYSNLSYADIAQLLNYADGNHFAKQFTKRAGLTPRQYRKHTFGDR